MIRVQSIIRLPRGNAVRVATTSSGYAATATSGHGLTLQFNDKSKYTVTIIKAVLYSVT